MKKVFCDGCDRAGIQKDLTGRHDVWHVRLDGPKMMDLCPERCAPLFKQFHEEIRRLQANVKAENEARIQELVTQFWKEIETRAP